jgi:CheY-like chemotaxis protein
LLFIFAPSNLIAVDERDLAKLISCVLLNAIKFTESGRIDITASLSPKAKYMSITLRDTGPGIPKDFLPYLFQPFSREDESITRQKDGLGLGLLVAKGLVRKIGGDLTCVRSDTSGPDRGSEFQIRVPLTASDNSSHPGTPLNRTPTPSGQINGLSLDSLTPHTDASTLDPGRGRRLRSTSDETPGVSSVPTLSTSTAESAQPESSSPSPYKQASNSFSDSRSHSYSHSHKAPKHNPHLATLYPFTFLIAEDNKLNRHLLVSMLRKLGYAASQIHEAHDGVEAVRQMKMPRPAGAAIDVVLMDLWMPNMDGYEATRQIVETEMIPGSELDHEGLAVPPATKIKIMAVSADVTSDAMVYAKEVGMCGFMTKPYKLLDLERLIKECCECKP